MLCASCSPQVQTENVVGTYLSNHGHGVETLTLHPTGRYTLVHKEGGKIVLQNEGQWALEKDDRGNARLSFERYVFGYRDRDPFPDGDPGYWLVTVDQTWSGKLKLPVDPDLGYAYVKAGR